MRYIKTYEKYTLTFKEKKYIEYVLNVNENINESFIDRVKSIGKKGLLTAAMFTALLNNPAFAKEYRLLPNSEKNSIENLITDTNNTKIGIEEDNEVNISSSFKSGRYEINEDDKSDILEKLNKLVNYANKHKSKKYVISIIASESLVPNKDYKTGEILPTLELSKRRAQQVKPIVEEFLKTHNTPNIKLEVKIIKGDTKWVPSKGKDSKEYLKDQYVKIQIDVDNTTKPEAICDVIGDANSGKEGAEKNRYISYTKSVDVTNQYGSGSIILKPGSIPDRVLVYADGKIVGDSGFFADQKHHSTPDFKYIPRCVLHLTKLYNESRKNSDIIATTELNKLNVVKIKTIDELMNLMLKDATSSKTAEEWAKSNNQDIGPAIKEMIGMFNRGQREFVIYDIGSKKVPYKLDGKIKDVKIVVISPIPQTQFSISVDCSEGISK